jgi:hypothetical protein
MQSIITDVLKVLNSLNATLGEPFHPVVVRENGLFQLLLHLWEFDHDFLVSLLFQDSES